MVDNHQTQWWLQGTDLKLYHFWSVSVKGNFGHFLSDEIAIYAGGPFCKNQKCGRCGWRAMRASWNNCSPTPPFLRTIQSRQRPNRGTSTFSLFSNFDRLDLLNSSSSNMLFRKNYHACLACTSTKTNYSAESMRELDWLHTPRFPQFPQMCFCQSNWLGNTKSWLKIIISPPP